MKRNRRNLFRRTGTSFKRNGMHPPDTAGTGWGEAHELCTTCGLHAHSPEERGTVWIVCQEAAGFLSHTFD
eukprot:jgi/Botrbrau1/20065/Bobra.200_1s0069.1